MNAMQDFMIAYCQNKYPTAKPIGRKWKFEHDDDYGFTLFFKRKTKYGYTHGCIYQKKLYMDVLHYDCTGQKFKR